MWGILKYYTEEHTLSRREKKEEKLRQNKNRKVMVENQL